VSKPLTGVKVVELATFVAGPSCARLLSDMGAEVIKIEHPKGDGWRQTSKSYIPGRFSDDENPVFDIYNSGKQHIALNLKNPSGMAIMHKLLEQADVFISNTRPAALQRLGLDYDTLKVKYPKLVYAMLLGYGEKGPDAAKPAFDTTAFWARSGFLSDLPMAGDHYMPMQPPSSVGDTFTGYLLLAEIIAALYRRTTTGTGDCVRAGLYHNAIFGMGTMAIVTQKPFGRIYPKTRLECGAPGGSYLCADGEWVFNSMAPAEKLFQLIGREDLLEDPKFGTGKGRHENMQEVYGLFCAAFRTKDSHEWVRMAEELDIPQGRRGHFSELTEDEQAWANGYLEHVKFASGNVNVMPSSPIEMDSVGKVTTKTAHAVGEDTDAVLRDLGYTDEQIAQLHTAGATSL